MKDWHEIYRRRRKGKKSSITNKMLIIRCLEIVHSSPRHIEVGLNLKNEETFDHSDNFMILRFCYNSNHNKICFKRLLKNRMTLINTKLGDDNETWVKAQLNQIHHSMFIIDFIKIQKTERQKSLNLNRKQVNTKIESKNTILN